MSYYAPRYPSTGQAPIPFETPTVLKNLYEAAATFRAMIPVYESQAVAFRGTPQGLYFQNLAQQTRLQLQGVQAQIAAGAAEPAGTPQLPPPPRPGEGAPPVQYDPLRETERVLQMSLLGMTPGVDKLRFLATRLRAVGRADVAAYLEALAAKEAELATYMSQLNAMRGTTTAWVIQNQVPRLQGELQALRIQAFASTRR